MDGPSHVVSRSRCSTRVTGAAQSAILTSFFSTRLLRSDLAMSDESGSSLQAQLEVREGDERLKLRRRRR